MRLRMSVWLVVAAFLAVACSGVDTPESRDMSATPRKLALVPGAATAEATAPLPTILNPYEEIQAFAPTGILRWSQVPGADAYEVWAYTFDVASGYQLAEFSGALASRQYQFTKLAGGAKYYVRMYFRVAGTWNETPLFPLTTVTSTLTPRLTNPQDELEAFGEQGVVRWTASLTESTWADWYELWIFGDPGLQTVIEQSGPIRQQTQYQLRNTPPGRTYYAQIYTHSSSGFHVGGALPLTVVAAPDEARLINPQEELDAFGTTGILRWTPVAGATRYEVWIFTNPNASEIYESSGALQVRSYTTRTLQPDSTYFVQVHALVGDQWQVGSPVRIKTAGQVTIARLTTVQDELERFDTRGTLRWSAVAGADRYEVWIYGNPGLGFVAEAGVGVDNAYTVGRLCKDGTYYVQVYARVNGQWTTGWATRLDVVTGDSPMDCVAPAPTARLTADATAVPSGGNVKLTWTSKFATYCSASGAWSGAKALSGEETVGPLATRSQFRLYCGNLQEGVRAQELVTIEVPRYTVTALGTVPGYVGSWGRALNDAGEVAGWVVEIMAGTRPARPFVYRAGQMQLLLPPRTGGQALGINAAGQVVGQSTTAFLSGGGVLTNLGTLGGSTSSAQGVNATGQVVGWSATAVPGQIHAFSYANGRMTDLGTLPGAPSGASSWAYGVNSVGQIVGTSDSVFGERQAFLFTGGDMQPIAGLGSVAYAVDDAGRVVGGSGRDMQAFLYSAERTVLLGTLGGSSSAAYAVNDDLSVVGEADTGRWTWNSAVPGSSGQDMRAFLYSAGSMHDLNDLLLQPLAATLTDARAISAHGQIVANACYPYLLSGGIPFTECGAFLLTPVAGASAPR